MDKTYGNKNYYAFLAAEAKLEWVSTQIDNIICENTDHAHAEKIIAEEWLTRLAEAVEKTKETFDVWCSDVKTNSTANILK